MLVVIRVLLFLLAAACNAQEAEPAAGYHFMTTETLLEIVAGPASKPDEIAGAFRALAFSGDPAGVPRIGRLLDDFRTSPRAVSLLRILGHIGDPRAVPIAARHRDSPNPQVAATARATLAEILGAADAQTLLRNLEFLEKRVGMPLGTPGFCDKLRPARLLKGDNPILLLDPPLGVAITRVVALSCPDAARDPVEGLTLLPEQLATELLPALEKPGAGGRADEIFGLLGDYAQDGVPVLAEALSRTADAALRLRAARLLAEQPWKASRRGPLAMEPDFVVERVEALSRAFADTDAAVRLAAIAGAAALIESQGDGNMMSTGYRRFRYRKALRAFVEPAARLLTDRPEIREKAIAALRSMRVPDANAALAKAGIR